MKLYRYQIWVSTPTGAKTIAPWDPDNLTLPRIIQDNDGEWCSADEVAKLEEECERLRNERVRLSLLLSRYERIHNALQEAGVIS